MKHSLSRLALLALGTMLTLLAARHFFVTLSHPWPVEYGEGVNLLWAQRVAQRQPLYPGVAPDSFPHIHHPYPPLGATLNGFLLRHAPLPHPFFGGRLLGTIGVLLAAHAVYALVRKKTDRATAAGGALLFVLSPMMLRFGPMMRIDALALGLALQSIRLLDKQKLFPAALLAGLALMAKPTYAAAACVVLWMAFRQKKAPPLFKAVGGLVLFPLGLLLGFRSPRLLLHLWELQGLPPDVSGFFDWAASFTAQHALVLALAVAAVLRGGKAVTPLRLYGLLALVPPLVTSWVTGSQENYLMEVWALACIVTASAWPDAVAKHPATARAVLFAQLLLFLPIAPAPVFTRTYGQELPEGPRSAWTPTREDLEVGRLVISELEIAEGSVLSADPGFALAAGHEILYQPFQFERLTASGKWDATLLHNAIRNREFSHILLKGMADEAGDAMFSPETQSLIDTHYELHRVLGPWRLYRRAL